MWVDVDLEAVGVRGLNERLHAISAGARDARWRVRNPHGLHNIAVGADSPASLFIEGHVGYYCAGMNKLANITVAGARGGGAGREHDVRRGASSRQCQLVGWRDRTRRPAGHRGRRQFALRHFHEGNRHRSGRLGGTHERVYGPGWTPGRGAATRVPDLATRSTRPRFSCADRRTISGPTA